MDKCSCGIAECLGSSYKQWHDYYDAMEKWRAAQPVRPQTCTIDPSPRFVSITKGDPQFEKFLIDVEREIRARFPNNIKIIDRSYIDPESSVVTECFCLAIQTSLDVELALELLEKFTEEWLIDNNEKNDVCVTLEFVN